MIACAAKGIPRIQPSRSSGCPLVWTEKDLRRLGEGRSGRGGPQRGAKGHRRRPLDFAPGNPRRQNRKSKVSKSEIPGVRYFFTAMVPNASRHAHGSLGVRTPGVSWRRRREPPGVELFFTASAGVTFFTARVRIPAKGSKTLALGSPPSPDPAPNAGFSPDEPFGASGRQWTLLQPLLRTWRPLADCHSKNTLNSGSTPLPTLAHVKRGLPPLDQFACMNAGSQRKGAG